MKTLYKILFILSVFTFYTCVDDEPGIPIGTGNKIIVDQNSDTVSYWSAIYNGTITNVKERTILQHGHCWDTLPEVDLSKNFTALGSTNEDVEFTSLLEELQPNKTYYIRAYFELDKETVIGKEETFKTPKIKIVQAIEKESAKTDLYTAVLCGEITDTGGELLTKGFYYSENPNVTESDNQILNSIDSTIFIDTLTNLQPNKTYYAKVFGTNRAGIGFSSEFSFTTNTKNPELTTIEPSEITANSCLSGGNISDDFGNTILLRGVCWSRTELPTIKDDTTINSFGIGVYSSLITGLESVTTYHVRAYATNKTTTVYGNMYSFITDSADLPVLSTNVTNNITQNSASCGGNIISDNGSSVTERGVCWAINEKPTITDYHTSDGSGIGNFTSELSDLTYNTAYFVRAYATTNNGTAYGNQREFTTLDILPKLTTITVTEITDTTVVSGGEITYDGGAEVIEKGVCWSISSNPTIYNTHTSDGIGTSNFVSNVTGLAEGTTYYIRSYATNSNGTGYGNELNFKTTSPFDYGQVTDIDGNIYKTVTIGTQEWMAENLKTTTYPNGNPIPLVTDNPEWANLRYNDSINAAAYCYYNNNSNGEKDIYGALYTYMAAKDACPTGWHLPTDNEWKKLEIYLGMSQSDADDSGWRGTDEGKKLKATSGWDSNGNGIDIYGFSALPGGSRYYVDGEFYNTGGHGSSSCWWSSTENTDAYGYYIRILYNDDNSVRRGHFDMTEGYSVRCVCD